MKISNIRKQKILEGFIDIFTRIACREYQKRVWIKGEGSEVDDFDDTVCDFFVECDSILENYKDFNLTDNQYNLLKSFRGLFDSFVDGDRPYLPKDFIDTPEWKRITDLAKKILKEFNYTKQRK